VLKGIRSIEFPDVERHVLSRSECLLLFPWGSILYQQYVLEIDTFMELFRNNCYNQSKETYAALSDIKKCILNERCFFRQFV